MAQNNFSGSKKGLNVKPTTLPVTGNLGDLAYDSTTNTFKQWNGSAWSIISGGSGAMTSVTYTSSGNFTVPADVTQVIVEGLGGGGGGGSGGGDQGAGGSSGGGGGGSGAVQTTYLSAVTPNTILPVVIGAGGNGGSGVPGGSVQDGNDGASGDNSTFNGLTFKGAPGGGRGYRLSTGPITGDYGGYGGQYNIGNSNGGVFYTYGGRGGDRFSGTGSIAGQASTTGSAGGAGGGGPSGGGGGGGAGRGNGGSGSAGTNGGSSGQGSDAAANSGGGGGGSGGGNSTGRGGNGGSGWIRISYVTNGGSSGSFWSTSVQTGTHLATVNEEIFVDTSGGAATMTLPAGPSVGNRVKMVDYAGTWATNSVTVERNGANINGVAADFILNVNNSWVEFVYIDSIQGWKVIT